MSTCYSNLALAIFKVNVSFRAFLQVSKSLLGAPIISFCVWNYWTASTRSRLKEMGNLSLHICVRVMLWYYHRICFLCITPWEVSVSWGPRHCCCTLVAWYTLHNVTLLQIISSQPPLQIQFRHEHLRFYSGHMATFLSLGVVDLYKTGRVCWRAKATPSTLMN